MSRSDSHARVVLEGAFPVLFCIVVLSADAQELDMPLSPSPVGSGARAAGMADAFVAIADDATAASWNPAGLVQLERPELSIVGAFNGVSEEFFADYHDEFDSTHTDENFDLNYLSFVYPLPILVLGKNVVVSLSYQRKYDFSKQFDVDYNRSSVLSNGTVVSSFSDWSFEQEGGLSTITPAIATELTHTLSVGVAVNLWRSSFLSDNDWEQTIRLDSDTFLGGMVTSVETVTREKYRDFTGENVTLGALWNVTDRWNIGIRYDSAFTGTADYESTTRRVDTNPFSITTTRIREKRQIRFPDTLAAGAAFRVNDKLTLALDISRTDWNDFYVKDSQGREFSLIDATDLSDPRTRIHLDPTYTVRFGAEHVFIPKQRDEDLKQLWTVRGGLFYDEEPATGRSTRNSISRGDGDPDRFYGFAAGLGLLAFQRFNFDVAYQLRYGPGVNSDFVRGIPGFEEDVVQHRVLLSTVIYF